MQDEITVTGLHMVNTKTDENEFVPVDDDTAVIFTKRVRLLTLQH